MKILISEVRPLSTCSALRNFKKFLLARTKMHGAAGGTGFHYTMPSSWIAPGVVERAIFGLEMKIEK